MITKSVTMTVSADKATLSENVVLFKGDKGVCIEITLKQLKYQFGATVTHPYEIERDTEAEVHVIKPSKEEFTTKAYGYKHKDGDWPECRLCDYEALTRCVIELYEIIEGKTSTVSKKQWYKITTPRKRGISPEQVKELIIKYGGIIDPAFDYKSESGVYTWIKDTKVHCIQTYEVRKDAIEVFPTIEITTIKQKEKHENQFQRKKARIERGTRPKGSTVCGRRSKASVAVGHLGYRKVTGI